MIVPDGMKVILDPKDEYTHAPEAAKNYNESMYFNAMDEKAGVGLWVRIGNRLNEGHAEMTCCVYLPDGKVGFMFARPEIRHNREMAAGGMRFEVVEPFKTHNVSYEGTILLMERPEEMMDPGQAFKNNPKVPCTISLRFEGVSPMHGGEIVNMDGSPWDLDPDKSVFRGHTEQHMSVSGTISVDGVDHAIDGFGFRDKSWGPRHWDNFYWYKWQPMTFSPDFGIMMSLMGQPDGEPFVNGHVFADGKLHKLTDIKVSTTYDESYMPTHITTRLFTAEREYVLEGERVTTIPLRHLRKQADGSVTFSRITEALMRYSCEGMTCFGMSENLDLMEDGVPLSVRLEVETA
ncbi:MAG: hypothetical protein AB7E60_05400 [Sphingobium sp.]